MEPETLYGELVRNRRVVVVGPASGIRGTNSGPRIDSFDLVVRINSQWPVEARLVPDVGSRADIIYHCCAPHSHMNIFNVPEFANVKFVWYQENPKTPVLSARCATYGIPCHSFDSVRNRLTEDLQTVPNTGTIAIAHLLSTPLKELHVTGFSFYDTPYYEGYVAHGARRRYWKRLWWTRRPERIWKHSFSPQRSYFRKLCDSDPRLTIDAELARLVPSW